MQINSGMVKAAAGLAITATGIMIRKSEAKCISSGLIGFGLASIILGSVDLCCEYDLPENPTVKKYIKCAKINWQNKRTAINSPFVLFYEKIT